MKRRENKISPCLISLWTSKEYGLPFIKRRKEKTKKNSESQSQIHFHFSPKPNLGIKCIRKKILLIWAYAFIYLFILNWLHVHLLSFKPCDDFTFYLFLWEELVPLELELNI